MTRYRPTEAERKARLISVMKPSRSRMWWRKRPRHFVRCRYSPLSEEILTVWDVLRREAIPSSSIALISAEPAGHRERRGPLASTVTILSSRPLPVSRSQLVPLSSWLARRDWLSLRVRFAAWLDQAATPCSRWWSCTNVDLLGLGPGHLLARHSLSPFRESAGPTWLPWRARCKTSWHFTRVWTCLSIATPNCDRNF